MGVIHMVLPLDEPVRGWLADWDVDVPTETPNGRWPTEDELREALDAMPGWCVRYRDTAKGWDAEIVGTVGSGDRQGTSLWVTRGAPGSVKSFAFISGWPELAVALLARLAATCGPFVLSGDGADPELVTAREEPPSRQNDRPSPREGAGRTVADLPGGLLFTNVDLTAAAREHRWFAADGLTELQAEADGEQSVVVFRVPRDAEMTPAEFWLRCLERLGYVGRPASGEMTRFLEPDAPAWRAISEEAAVGRLADPFLVATRPEGWHRGKVDPISITLDGVFIGAQASGWPDDDDLETWIVVASDREFVALIWDCSA